METTNFREFKVGNWVKFRHKDLNYSFTSGVIIHMGPISYGGKTTTMYNIKSLQQDEEYQVIDADIDVLPLTEEYIVQLGFKKVSDKTFQQNGWTLTDLGQIITGQPMEKIVSKNNGFTLSGYGVEQTVHELQVVQNIMNRHKSIGA